VSGVRVTAWAAWSPGLETREQWVHWAGAPAPLGEDGVPDARFLPAMLRRRCSRLTRVMLHAAHECVTPEALAAMPVVFASRHGETGMTVTLLEALGRRQPLTATAFSHSVHNAPAGLFSIAVGNRRISSAVAAGEDTFPCAFVEALGVLHRAPRDPVLLVTGDEPLPAVFRPLVDEPQATYAVALVLERGGENGSRSDGVPVCLRCSAATASDARPAWPPAVEFLRWLISGEPALSLGTGRHCWMWTRGDHGDAPSPKSERT